MRDWERKGIAQLTSEYQGDIQGSRPEGEDGVAGAKATSAEMGGRALGWSLERRAFPASGRMRLGYGVSGVCLRHMCCSGAGQGR